ncbi:hypothetical protein LCGC14_2641930 [marine sediment metagenome]|uniref:Uncharacterized protein n=1 Tax=marine sediment metagenome TaxID=412755 RepID=A0A0F8ZXF6_9ZZZZ
MAESKVVELSPKSNEAIAYYNAMTVVEVTLNDGRRFNIILTEKLDDFLIARKEEIKRRR